MERRVKNQAKEEELKDLKELQTQEPKPRESQPQEPQHTVSFDWFLSGLEWNINLEFCLLKLLIFYLLSEHT